METLPHCQDLPDQLVISRQQRNGYNHAIQASGAEVGFDEIRANAGVVYVYSLKSEPDLREVVQITHQYHLPALVDAVGRASTEK